MNKKSLHDGHRARMRERYYSSDFSEFNHHEILELLLFFGIPRRDTNEIAHQLINHFGSFSGVLDASIDELLECKLSRNAAIYLKSVFALTNKYVYDKNCDNKSLDCAEDLENRLMDLLSNETEEKVALAMYNAKGMELFLGIISEEKNNWTEKLFAKLSELSVRYHATTMILAHNKPNGIAAPTEQDIDNTMKIFNSLAKIGARLNDHYIVAGNELYSMVEDKNLRVIFS